MIDSVTIHSPRFITYSDEFFTKAQYQELRGKFGVFGRYTTRYTTYPQQCKAKGRYFPQVHIVEHSRRTKKGSVPSQRQLVIQVSLPKLVFGSSIFDIDERLLPVAAQKLSEALAEIKVGITSDDILDAIVHRLDYSKIIQISPRFGTTDRVLRALAPYDLKQSSDFNRSHYHDGRDGFYLKYFNSSQGFVVYDKFDEIVVNGKTNLEQTIGQAYKAGTWKKGALRIELSLQKKQTVDGTLKQHYKTKKKDFTLQEAGKTSIAKACLLRTFDSVYVTDFNRLVHLGELKDTQLLHVIEEHTGSLHDRAILYYLVHGVRSHGLKATIEGLKKEVSPATVGRYKKAIEKILGTAEAKKDTVNIVSYIRRKLATFRPVLPKKLESILTVAGTKNEV